MNPEQWTCTCPSPNTDVLGECDECHRVPLQILLNRRKDR